MPVRGVRGANTVSANRAEDIYAATQELLQAMLAANGIAVDDLAAAFFSLTEDLDAAFPATAARRLGWQYVPLFDTREIPVPGSLPRCIRVLLLWNSDTPSSQVVHVYLGDSRDLRPDLSNGGGLG